ncbi:MAG: extracellular solute-binding protein [Eubacteriales bacterium]|nr:extracellular solute-binding protein [Eubacteriales bacterium]
MSTIKDVARHAGVSVGTVSNYMTGTRSVSAEMSKQIQSAINELGYKPNSYAKNLRTNNNLEIGVILPNTYDQYYSYLLAGLERELKQAGYYVNLALSDDVPEEEITILDGFMRKDMCGLIVVSCQNNYHCFDGSKRTPAVFIDRKPGLADVNYISFDSYEATRYLLNELRREGCETIALFAGPASLSCEADSARAFREFYAENDLPNAEKYLRNLRATKEEAFRTGVEFFSSTKPDAVISTSRNITNGLEQALSLLGISVNNDIRFVSFGQENWSRSVTSNGVLHTMRPAHLLGKKAARLLLDNIKSPLMFEKQQIVMHDKIIGRGLFLGDVFPTAMIDRTRPIKVLMLNSPSAHAILHTHSDFTRKTGLNVDITLNEHRTLLNRLLNKEAVSDFDVVMYDNPWLEILVRNKRLTDITSYTQSPDFSPDVFLPHLFEKVGFVDERCYGAPFMYGPQILLYRKDLFENKQLQEQFEKKYRARLRVPRTWFEFNVVSSFFTRKCNPNSPIQYGTAIAAGNEAVLIPELMPRVWAYGGHVFDENGEAATSSTAFRKGVSNFIETFSYASPSTRNYTVEQTVADFYNGNIAMLIGFASFVADVNNDKKSKIIGKIGYSNIPGGVSVLGSWALGIPPESKRKEEAFAFIRWTCDPSMSNYFAVLDGQSPLENVYINDELASHYPWLPIIYRSYETNRQRKSVTRGDGIFVPITNAEHAIYKAIDDILQENCSVEDALKRLTETIDQFSDMT